jgi:hypothetical protein
LAVAVVLLTTAQLHLTLLHLLEDLVAVLTDLEVLQNLQQAVQMLYSQALHQVALVFQDHLAIMAELQVLTATLAVAAAVLAVTLLLEMVETLLPVAVVVAQDT